jgi:hypothetical protein
MSCPSSPILCEVEDFLINNNNLEDLSQSPILFPLDVPEIDAATFLSPIELFSNKFDNIKSNLAVASVQPHPSKSNANNIPNTESFDLKRVIETVLDAPLSNEALHITALETRNGSEEADTPLIGELNLKVAGYKFSPGAIVSGQRLTLAREENVHDSSAVGIYNLNGERTSWIPMMYSGAISQLLETDVEIVAVSPVLSAERTQKRILIKLYGDVLIRAEVSDILERYHLSLQKHVQVNDSESTTNPSNLFDVRSVLFSSSGGHFRSCCRFINFTKMSRCANSNAPIQIVSSPITVVGMDAKKGRINFPAQSF